MNSYYEDLIARLRSETDTLSVALLHDAADAIEDLITALTASNEVIAKSKPKWIPVKERFPEKYDRVLVFSKATRMGRGIDFINSDGNWFSTQKVTHWMPLPAQPKDGEA